MASNYEEVFGERSIVLLPDGSYFYNGYFFCVAPFFVNHGEWGRSNDTLLLYEPQSSISVLDSSKEENLNLTFIFETAKKQLYHNYFLWIEYKNDSISYQVIDRDSIIVPDIASINEFAFLDNTRKWHLHRTVNSENATEYRLSIQETQRTLTDPKFLILKNGRLREIGGQGALFNRN